MWRRIVVAFSFMCVFYNHILSHPILDSTDNGRQSRQLDFGECCPCPTKGSGRLRDTWPAPTVLDPSQRSVGLNPRTGLMDDCPCRGRDADSDGSSSIFFPTAARPNAPSMKSAEDPKNLLEPEVGLASSVLETLRVATEEEYRDAVEREAARARAAEDATPEESARNFVTIIVGPKQSDDNELISEASHVQESRCIHPIGSSLGKIRSSISKSPNILTEIFKLPETKSAGLLHRKQLDRDSSLGASDVHERVLEANSGIVRSSTNSNSLRDSNNDECDRRSASILNKFKPLKNKNDMDSTWFDRPFVPRIRQNNQFRNSNNDYVRSSGLSFASTNIDEQIPLKQNPRFSLRTLLDDVNTVAAKRPMSLKNLLKLRDVEFISPMELRDKGKDNSPVPIFPPLVDRDNVFRSAESDLPDKIITLKSYSDYKASNDYDQKEEVNSPEIKAQNTPQRKTAQTEILDIVPSASNINNISDNSCDAQDKPERPPITGIKENLEIIHPTLSNDELMETEIIDTLPNASENRPLVVHINDNGNAVMDIIENQSNDKDTCHVSPNNEILDLPEQEDETSNASSDETNVVPNDDDQTILNSEDNETDSSNSLESASTSCLENTEQNQDLSFENNKNEMQSDLKNLNGNSDAKSTTEDVAFSTAEHTKQADNLQENKAYDFRNKNKQSTQNMNLLALTKNVVKNIEDLKRSSKLFNQKVPEKKASKEFEDRLLINSEQSGTECRNYATEKIITTTSKDFNIDLSDTNNNLNHISMQDLQKLSDSLLKKSNGEEKYVPTFKNDECDEERSLNKNGFNSKIAIPQSLSDTSEAEQNFAKSAEIINNVFTADKTLMAVNNKPGNGIHTNSIKDSTTNMMLRDNSNSNSTDVVEDSLKSLSRSEEMNEMTAEASNPFTSAIRDPLNLFGDADLRLPLLQDIVQPSSMFGDNINIFDKPILDIGSPLNLPSLDDIRERLASIFGIETRATGDELTECTDDSSLMSAEASNSNFQTKSPLKPLKDINLDIFQVKPLTKMKSNSISDIPRLNLKSYKAKLPIPKNLDLKPMKLQSTLGNKGGLLGTILTVGPETRTMNKFSEVVSRPLGNLPDIEDMRAAMKTNVENLLNSPLALNTNLFNNNLRPTLSMNSLSDNLRSHAENTIRDIQERMESTLQGVKVSDLLGGQLNKPQDLLEKIVEAREDFSDKLKGLHYDLNDRLTSLHDNILDQARLMSLNNPVLQEKSTQGNIPHKSNSRLVHSQKPAPTLQRLTLENRKESQNNNANSQRDPMLGHLKTKNVKDESKLRTFKIPTAASVPVPKSVEVPKLKLVPAKSSISNFKKDPTVKDIFNHFNSRKAEYTQTPNLQRPMKPSEERRLDLRKQTNQFKDSKFKVTIASTTPSPLLTFKFKELTTSRPIQGAKARTKESDLSSSSTPRFQQKFSGAPKGSSSNVKPSRLLSATFSTESKAASSEDENAVSNKVNEELSPQTSTMIKLKQKTGMNCRTTPGVEVPAISDFKSNVRKPNSLRKTITDKDLPIGNLLPLTNTRPWPKITDNSFLSKVREAVQARLSNIDPARAKNAKTYMNSKNFKMSSPNSDMERAPSENSEVVLQEPLKENISYKCRMVCTRA